MSVFNGTIVNHSKTERGYWYTISFSGGSQRFFSRKEIFSLFENCEVVLEKKNNSYFLTDYSALDDISPLKQRPDNIIAAFWLSRLADSLTFSDSLEAEFINKCRQALSCDFLPESLDEIENCYLKISGFNPDEEKEKIIYDCFCSSINLRMSLINQISSRRRK